MAEGPFLINHVAEIPFLINHVVEIPFLINHVAEIPFLINHVAEIPFLINHVADRPGVGNRENRESSRWAASLLGRSRILFFDICYVSPSFLKVGYTRSAFWHRSLCMGCTMRGSSPLPNRVGW